MRCSSVEEMMSLLQNLEVEVQIERVAENELDLVRESKLVNDVDMETAEDHSHTHQIPLMKVLVDEGFLTPVKLQAINQCKHLIESTAINRGQGLIALTYCAENDVSFVEALNQFGWNRMSMRLPPRFNLELVQIV